MSTQYDGVVGYVSGPDEDGNYQYSNGDGSWSYGPGGPVQGYFDGYVGPTAPDTYIAPPPVTSNCPPLTGNAGYNYVPPSWMGAPCNDPNIQNGIVWSNGDGTWSYTPGGPPVANFPQWGQPGTQYDFTPGGWDASWGRYMTYRDDTLDYKSNPNVPPTYQRFLASANFQYVESGANQQQFWTIGRPWNTDPQILATKQQLDTNYYNAVLDYNYMYPSRKIAVQSNMLGPANGMTQFQLSNWEGQHQTGSINTVMLLTFIALATAAAFFLPPPGAVPSVAADVGTAVTATTGGQTATGIDFLAENDAAQAAAAASQGGGIDFVGQGAAINATTTATTASSLFPEASIGDFSGMTLDQVTDAVNAVIDTSTATGSTISTSLDQLKQLAQNPSPTNLQQATTAAKSGLTATDVLTKAGLAAAGTVASTAIGSLFQSATGRPLSTVIPTYGNGTLPLSNTSGLSMMIPYLLMGGAVLLLASSH